MTKRVLSSFVILFSFFSVCLAQYEKERMIWYFGHKAGLDFHTDPPVVLTDSKMSTIEGCAVANDNKGNLLFYTDGINIWDRQHKMMPNGSGLLGHASSTQSVLVVNKPGSKDLFYVFTTDAVENKGKNGLNYNIVDMSLNGGYGDVTVKNRLIREPSSEKVAACRHRNGKDYWILHQEMENNVYYAYLLTDKGLDTGYYVKSGFDYQKAMLDYDVGEMKFSFDRKKIAVAHAGKCGAEVFDFNDSSGVMSNPLLLDTSIWDVYLYGLTFSPNSRFLYTCHYFQGYGAVWQYDMQAGDSNDIRLSARKLEIEGTGSMQVAPNGKIYVWAWGALHVIPRPDEPYPLCGSENNAVTGLEFMFGLPNFPVVMEEYCAVEKRVVNVFTPDNDNINDTFTPEVCELARDYTLIIYNRWGQMLFKTIDLQQAWDGTSSGNALPEGTYFWIATYRLSGENKTTTGTLTLLR